MQKAGYGSAPASSGIILPGTLKFASLRLHHISKHALAMIWFVTAISILFAIVDWLVYRRRIRYKNNCIRRGFIGIVLVSYCCRFF